MLEQNVYLKNEHGYEVRVIEDSCGTSQGVSGNRLVTLQLKYPRFVHAEFMTHRVFSRNASSSRAIPVAKQLERIANEPAHPVYWGSNQKGMQAGAELEGEDLERAQELWFEAAKLMSEYSAKMNDLGVHKQIANRLCEPFAFITVIVTSSDWDNFFRLRCHPDAQPEIQELAYMMQDAIKQSSPKQLFVTRDDNDANYLYHLPYVSESEKRELPIDQLVRCSVARCARVSYLTHDNKLPSLENDNTLFNRLVVADPEHASPTEHQARLFRGTDTAYCTEDHNLHGNLARTWVQFRKYLEIKQIELF